MANSLLVSLVSDQTIPNIQLINEMNGQVGTYLFITTQAMETKGIRQWIINACGIADSQLVQSIVVNQFSFDEIENQLEEFPFESYDRLIVNLTGGTKVMTLAAFDFFRDLRADIYYITGSDDTLIRLAPGRKKLTQTLKSKVTLKQYLEAYGFSVGESEASPLPREYTMQLFNHFLTGIFAKHKEALALFRNNRSKGIRIKEMDQVRSFLKEIGYPNQTGPLTKYEARYLSGEWFEDYVAAILADELNLGKDYIKTGINITKQNKEGESIPNELDVAFMWKNKIYTIECKTSVFTEVFLPDGSTKPVQILGETVYKVESLKQGFGLFANATIMMLDDKEENAKNLKVHYERAILYGIRLLDRNDLVNSDTIGSLLGIHK